MASVWFPVTVPTATASAAASAIQTRVIFVSAETTVVRSTSADLCIHPTPSVGSSVRATGDAARVAGTPHHQL